MARSPTSANPAAGQFETVAIPKRLPLAAQPDNRDGTFAKDSQLVNCYLELDRDDNQYWIWKRPGHSARVGDLVTAGLAVGRGLYLPEPALAAAGATYIAVNGPTVNKWSGAGAGVSIGTVATSLFTFAFETIRSAPVRVVFNSSVGAYFTDGVTVTDMATLPNFPATSIKGWAYLDGTLYVMTRACQIFGSGIDDPTTWSALNVIIARAETGTGVALTKHREYVVAMKTKSIEFFYDAGNAAGSPLSPMKGTTINYGCMSAEVVQSIDGELIWVTPEGKVLRLSGLQYRIVSVPPIERLLQASLPATGASSLSFRIAGHRFFCIPFGTFDLVYDLDTDKWYRWTAAGAGGVWPIAMQVSPAANLTFPSLVQRIDTGDVYNAGEDFRYPTDDGEVPTVEIYTPSQDFGTQREKQLAAMFFRGDQVTGSILRIRWSDDDYQTYSNFKEMNLGVLRPQLRDMGTFSNRAWNLFHQSATRFRLKTTDLQLDIGSV